MRSHITETPDMAAGKYVSSILESHKSQPVLLLLSGGSAFSILDHIDHSVLGEHITIGFVDERFTYDPQGNNFLLLSKTSFYSKALNSGVQFIESVPGEFEKHHEFAIRMNEQLDQYTAEHPSGYNIGIFGIGEDGHTAGIFPSPIETFSRIYQTGDLYIHVTQTAHEYAERTTVTPTFIEESLDEVVLYAVGKNKCENILDYMYNKTFTQHEIPALIPASHPQSMLFTDCPSITP